MFIPAISFKSTNNKYDTPSNAYKRVETMAIGTTAGTVASALLYKNKYSGKKLLLRSLETGALVGLTTDILILTAKSISNISNKQTIEPESGNKTQRIQHSLETIDIIPYRNKEFFIKLYSGANDDSADFKKYEKILADKNTCNKIFQDKEVLQASQEALLEINSKKIAEANEHGDNKTAKELEALNVLISKNLESNKQNSSQNSNESQKQNVSFKSIFNFFHNNNETLKQKAEVIVNRYASSAAATAGALANTGFGDTLALTLITKNMCKGIFKTYDCEGGYIAAITGASVGAVAGTNLLTKAATIWPGAGNALDATITYSLHQLEGRALIEFLEEYADDLDGMEDADIAAKYATRVKSGLNTIENDRVREILSKAIDKAFDVLL